ncbi:MAG: hypothetical protein U0Q16_31540 [Bryobacteraceae bacterium]
MLALAPVLPASRLQPQLSSFPPLLSPTGLAFPRGRITEIYGEPSSGRTSFLINTLAEATRCGETCAWVDLDNTFDPVSAAAAGVRLDRLLWIRCTGDAPAAMRCTDLLLAANGFGVVVVDLGDADKRVIQRIPPNYWYRFRRAVEPTRTVVVVVSQDPIARQCATLSVESRRVETKWSGTAGVSQLLDGVELRYEPRKPVGTPRAGLTVSARPTLENILEPVA